MPGKVATRLAELKIELPKAAAPVANYIPVVLTGNQAFVSGQVTVWNGEFRYQGQLGKDFQVEDGQKAARLCGYNIAYHLAQGVDFVIATDNASRDRTPVLLERFAKQGKLHLIHEPGLTFDQGAWVTRMARMAAKTFDADWVINNDADEFWLSEQGTVRDALAAIPPGTDCLSVRRVDLLPPRSTDRKFFESMLVYDGSGQSVHGTTLAPKACHRAYPDVQVAHGNHFVKRRGVRLAEESDHPLRILHFPLRSLDHLHRRFRRGSIALEPGSRMNPTLAKRWFRLYGNHLQPGQLEGYYRERAPSAEQIKAGIASGALICDTRIRDALRLLDLALVEADHM